VAEEYETFRATVTAWTCLREQRLPQTQRAIGSWECANLPLRLQQLERGLQLQHRRMRLLRQQLG
jgi:hypothetical protein